MELQNVAHGVEYIWFSALAWVCPKGGAASLCAPPFTPDHQTYSDEWSEGHLLIHSTLVSSRPSNEGHITKRGGGGGGCENMVAH